MKILIRNTDSVAVYAGDDLTLSATELRGDSWVSKLFTTANATLVDADLPAHWSAGVWSYIGGVWTVADAPAYAAQFNAVRVAKRAAIKAERDRRKSGGVHVGDKWYHSDPDSRIQQLGLVLMGASVPSVPWKTMDGTFATMSQALAGQIFGAVAALDMALFANAEAHTAAMLASGDPAGYDLSTGWPGAFA